MHKPRQKQSKNLALSAKFLLQRYGERDNTVRFDVAIGSV